MKQPFTVGTIVVLLAGCSFLSNEVDIWTAYGAPDSNELLLEVDSCNADLSAAVDEQPDQIVISVTAENDTSDDCLDAMTIELASLLGDRVVVDSFDGEALEVLPSGS